MIYSTGEKNGGVANAAIFLIKRFSRIWPLYAFGTVLYVCFLWASGWLSLDSYKALLLSLLFYPVSPHPILDVGWTLNLEIYFYLILAICLIFDRLRWVAASCWVAITLFFQYITSILPVSEYNGWFVPYYYQAIHPCILEFFFGMLIALFYKSKISFRQDVGILIAATLISFAVWQYLEGFLGKVGMAGVGIGATALVLGFVVAEKAGVGWRPENYSCG